MHSWAPVYGPPSSECLGVNQCPSLHRIRRACELRRGATYLSTVFADRGTAGESEMLASALRAQCCAVVYGDATRRRSCIQAACRLLDVAGMVLTVAEYRASDSAPYNRPACSPDVSLSSNIDKPKVDWQLLQHVASKCSAPEPPDCFTSHLMRFALAFTVLILKCCY